MWYSCHLFSAAPGSTSTVVYAMIGAGVVVVLVAILLAMVLIGKRKRVTAKLWRPTSPSDVGTSGDVAGAQGGSTALPTDSAL